ncbi:pilus assembly protein [Myxococcaceae bacterium JPH2]|nr:pilus assembly protein [Myxococcaceae bacterium JPH2]
MKARNREDGQAAVETAIVLPLFVFLILGTLQLGLMHQARLMTKYAAYKAVRAGSIHSANVGQMEKAALGVLLPMVSKPSGGAEYIKTVTSGSEFAAKFAWPEVMANKMMDSALKYAEVTICGPLRNEVGGGSGEFDFDNPKNSASDDWAQGQRTKLRVQVTFNYRMPIPFADMVIYQIVRARELPPVLRLGKTPQNERKFRKNDGQYEAAAAQRHYVLPIRATYTMRMQSNFFLSQNPLPQRNECVFTWQ